MQAIYLHENCLASTGDISPYDEFSTRRISREEFSGTRVSFKYQVHFGLHLVGSYHQKFVFSKMGLTRLLIKRTTLGNLLSE
jgi:hypothetical protein